MRTKKHKIDFGPLNEYVYTLLFNSTYRDKKAIPSRILKFVRSSTEAKKFIRRSNLDEKLSVLSFLGVKWFLVFANDETVGLKDLKKLLEQFQKEQKINSLSDIVALNLFVTSSKEFLYLLTSCAHAINSKAFRLKHEQSRSTYHVSKWNVKLSNGDGSDEVDSYNLILKTILNASLVINRANFLFNCTANEIQLLIYFFCFRNNYIPATKVQEFFAGQFSNSKVTINIRVLLKLQLLQKSAINEKEYSITSNGIRVINEFLCTVFHANNFI